MEQKGNQVKVDDVKTLLGDMTTPGLPQDAQGVIQGPVIDDEYKALIHGMAPDEAKQFAQAVRDVRDLNGTGDIAGVAASFIKDSEFFHSFAHCGDNADVKKLLFMAHNWAACGKGKGGLCGAAVRWTLRSHFKPGREYTEHRVAPAGSGALCTEYNNQLKGNQELVNFFMTNALSVATLAGALMNKTGHHWNNDHRSPQVAFINSLGLQDSFNDNDYRKVFYIAVHPLPLLYTERLRAAVADGKLGNIAEVVRLRCGGPPCGFGVINVCAAAVYSMLAEPFMNEAHYAGLQEIPINGDADQAAIAATTRRNREIEKKNHENEAIIESLPRIRAGLRTVYDTNKMLCDRASEYHMFATHYGFAERSYLDIVPLTHAMCLLAAYILSKVGGTLSRSPALAKFVAQHSRAVTKATRAFQNETDGEGIYDVFASKSFLPNAGPIAQAGDHVNANHQADGVV